MRTPRCAPPRVRVLHAKLRRQSVAAAAKVRARAKVGSTMCSPPPNAVRAQAVCCCAGEDISDHHHHQNNYPSAGSERDQDIEPRAGQGRAAFAWQRGQGVWGVWKSFSCCGKLQVKAVGVWAAGSQGVCVLFRISSIIISLLTQYTLPAGFLIIYH